MDQDLKTMVFMAVWTAIALGAFILLQKRMDPKVKRGFIIKLNVIASILFCAFVFWIIGDLKTSIILVPIVAMVSLCNIRIMQVCNSCSAVQMDRMQLFSTVKGFCRKCGAKIE